MNKKKILFLSNHSAFFVSHRLNIFEEAKKNNYDFYLIFGKADSHQIENLQIKKLKKKKVNFSKFDYSNNSFSLINDFWSLIKIASIIRKYKPTLIHSASPKANIYAGILAKFFDNIGLVMSFSGMGYLYTEKKNNLSLSVKKFLFNKLLSLIFSKKKKKIIVQNSNDYYLLKKKFNLIRKDLIHITGGSGVDIKKFSKIKRKKTKNIVMISRILKNKGVLEFFKASKLLKLKYPDWKFKIVGSSDYNSPDKINKKTIEYYQKKKNHNFRGI